MRSFSKKIIPFFIIILLLFSGCGSSGSKSKVSNDILSEIGSNSWIVADTIPVNLSAATPRANGPADWRDEIIYFIMTDRFCDGDSSNNQPFFNKGNINYYHGGDLQGIINQVDYIRSLGATAIWITPIMENVWQDPNYTSYVGYHGYWPYDFTKLDPHLGNGSAFYQQFINTMHNNGLLVIQDIVLNHMGPVTNYSVGWTPVYNSSGYTRVWDNNYSSGHAESLKPPFDQLSSFHNYGRISNYDDSIQLVTGDLSNLPDIKTEDSTVQNALINTYGDWASLGVDGFRVDTARNVETSFYDVFCPAIRSRVSSKNFLHFGEFWVGYHPTLSGYVSSSTGMDSVLNYDLYYVMRTVFGNALDAYHTNATSELTQELERRSSYTRGSISDGGNVSAQDALVNFIDNHDNNRFLTDDGGSLDRLWLALTYLMTTKGIPCIYYNTENNIFGDTNTGRKDLPDFNTTGKRTFSLIRVLSKIRSENVSLRRGDLTVLKDSNSAGIFAFARFNGDPTENVFILLNNSGREIYETIDISDYSSDGVVLRNILYTEFGLEELVTVNGGNITVRIPSYSMKIFKK